MTAMQTYVFEDIPQNAGRIIVYGVLQQLLKLIAVEGGEHLSNRGVNSDLCKEMSSQKEYKHKQCTCLGF